jgi:hypothetical protein
MSILGTNVDYTDKDFDSIRARLINLVASAFPEWTDFNVSNFGTILLELDAFTLDVLLFYQDNQARESRISTAQLRKSLLGLAKMLGYVPAGAYAATTELTITLGNVPTGDVTFEVGDTFRTLEITDPVVFQVLSQVVITGGTSPPVAVVQVENSSPASQTFSSTGLPNQEHILSETPYLDESAIISAANGAYTQVDDFLSSTSTDRHYTVTVDENDKATIRFGNGINGAIPQGSIVVSYKTGGGKVGNVEEGSIRKADKTYSDHLGNQVTLTVTNIDAADGGTNREGIEQIRQNAPRSLRALTRTVAREDFEINALRVNGVARALMLTSNERDSIDENAGMLHIVPTAGGLPSQTLKDDVEEMVTVTYPHTLTFRLSVEDPEYLTVDVQSTVFLRQGYSAAAVDATIRSNLVDWFAIENDDGSENENIDFGFNYTDAAGESAAEIAWSDIFNVVRDSSGVRKIDESLGGFLLNGVRSDVAIDVQKFPKLGTVTLLNGDTGGTLV